MSTPHSFGPKDHERTRSGAATKTRETDPQMPSRPSLLQITVSALTAVSATALLSFLGVWGTVLGMGLLSILTVLGNYMLSTFVQRTADRVKQAPPVLPRARASFPAVTGTWAHEDAEAGETSQSESGSERAAGRWSVAWRSMVASYGSRRIVVSIIAVFVLLAGSITVIELAAGKPLSNIVRNESGSGTSLPGGGTDDSTDPDASDDADGEIERGGDSDEHPQEEQEDPQVDEPPDDPADDPAPEEPPEDEPPVDEPPVEDPSADEPATEDATGVAERRPSPRWS